MKLVWCGLAVVLIATSFYLWRVSFAESGNDLGNLAGAFAAVASAGAGMVLSRALRKARP